MSAVTSVFGGGGNKKKKRARLLAEQQAAEARREVEVRELAKERRARIIASGNRPTVLSPTTGDATVGATLILGR